MKNIKKWDEFILESKDIDPDAEVRNRGDVVFPAESSKVKDNEDHFPINDADQARNALARVNQYDEVPDWYDGTLKELIDEVYDAVESEYPEIEIDKDKKTPGRG